MEKLVRTTLAAVLALAASACGDDDGATDTGTPDTGMPDTGTGDTGTGDTGTGDTGTGDGGDGSVSRCGADGLELPGDAFYPEGIAIGGDGTVYVGSLATGEVVRFPGGTGPAETFVASGGALTNTVGLLYDSARSIIWACTSNLTTFAGAAVVGLNEADGSVASVLAQHDDPLPHELGRPDRLLHRGPIVQRLLRDCRRFHLGSLCLGSMNGGRPRKL